MDFFFIAFLSDFVRALIFVDVFVNWGPFRNREDMLREFLIKSLQKGDDI